MWGMRSLITFTTRKFPLIHMVMLLSSQGTITGCIRGIHKHEMFECISSLDHCRGRVLWAQDWQQGQESCQRTLEYKGQSCCWSALSPEQGNSSLLDMSQPGKVFKHFQHGGDDSRAQICSLSSTSASNMALQWAQWDWTCPRLPHAIRPHT